MPASPLVPRFLHADGRCAHTAQIGAALSMLVLSWFRLGGLKSEVQHPAMLNRSMDCGLSHFRGPLDEVSEGLNGAAPVQRLARPVVQKVSNRVERHLVMDGQVRDQV